MESPRKSIVERPDGSRYAKLHKDLPPSITISLQAANKNLTDDADEFERVLDEMGIPERKKEAMRQMPKDKKLQVIQMQKQQHPADKEGPAKLLEKLDKKVTLASLRDLRVSLNSNPISWLVGFKNAGGHLKVHSILDDITNKLNVQGSTKDPTDTSVLCEMMYESLNCLKGLLNAEYGMQAVMELEDIAKSIASTLVRGDKKTRKIALDLLTVMGLFSVTGHRNVLAAWSYLKTCKKHKGRFQFLIDVLTESIHDRDPSLATTAMALINTIVNFPEDIFIRLQLRTELRQLMLEFYLDELRLLLDDKLDAQLDLYVNEATADGDAMEETDFDIKNPHDVVDLILRNVQDTEFSTPFLNILQKLLLVSNDEYVGTMMWNQIEDSVHRIVTSDNEATLDDSFMIKQLEKATATAQQAIDQNTQLNEQIRKQSMTILLDEQTIDELKLVKNIGCGSGTIMIGPKELERRLVEQQEELYMMKRELQHFLTHDVGERERALLKANAQLQLQLEVLKEEAVKEEIEIMFAEKEKEIRDLRNRLEKLLSGVDGTVAKEMEILRCTYHAKLVELQGLAFSVQKPGGSDVSSGAAPGAPPAPLAPGAPAPPKPGPKPKPVIVPPVKLRGLMWTKIPPTKFDESVWKKIDDASVKVDMNELCELFSVEEKVDNSENSSTAELAATPSKPQIIQVLDSKRSTNTGIRLSRLGMQADEVKTALMSVDEEKLDEARCVILLGCVPQPDEIEALKPYEGKTENLGTVEKFFLVVKDIPFLEQRIKSVNLKLTFEEKLNEIENSVSNALEAIREVETSVVFKDVLAIVLAIGNHLNGSTNRGQAFGFKLDNLVKLSDTKTADKKSTLLHFVARKLGPEKIKLREQLPHVEAAAKVVLDQVNAEFRQLDGQVKILEGALQRKPTPTDLFHSKMTLFHSIATVQMDKIKTKLEGCEPKFKKLAEAYCDDGKKLDEFFGVLFKFMRQLEKANEDNMKADELERRRVKEREAKDKRAEVAIPAPNERGLMEDLKQQLVVGGAFRQRYREKAPITMDPKRKSSVFKIIAAE